MDAIEQAVQRRLVELSADDSLVVRTGCNIQPLEPTQPAFIEFSLDTDYIMSGSIRRLLDLLVLLNRLIGTHAKCFGQGIAFLFRLIETVLLQDIAQIDHSKLRYHKTNRSDFVVNSIDYFDQYTNGVLKGYVTFSYSCCEFNHIMKNFVQILGLEQTTQLFIKRRNSNG